MLPKLMQWSKQQTSGAKGNPTKIKNHTATLYTHASGRQEIYLFGGYDGRRNHNDIHVLDCSTMIWTTPEVHGEKPPGRNGHTTTLAGDLLFVQGGWLGRGPLAADDIHMFDILSSTWLVPECAGESPGPCNMHTSDYIEHKNAIYVFRGGDGKDYLNDLHILDVNKMKWLSEEQAAVSGDLPSRRANHSSAVVGRKLCIFGGWDGKKRLNDIFILDTDTLVWSKPAVTGRLPAPRAGMSFTSVNGFTFLFGGSGAHATCFNDIQVFDLENQKWLSVAKEDLDGNDTKILDDGMGKSSAEFESRHGPREMTDNDYLVNRRYVVNGKGNTGQLNYTDDSNPNSYDCMDHHDVLLQGQGPAYRAGHTSTRVGRKIFLMGGSHGVEYKNDFFILDTDPLPLIEPPSLDSSSEFQKNLCGYFNDSEFSDVTFLVDGREIFAHKIILCTQSTYFDRIFKSGFRESKEKQVLIEDCSADTFMVMMEYLYTGKAAKCSIQNGSGSSSSGTYPDINIDLERVRFVCDVMKAADQFCLDRLKQICEYHLQSAVNKETVDELLDCAEMCNANRLQAICQHHKRNAASFERSRYNTLLYGEKSQEGEYDARVARKK